MNIKIHAESTDEVICYHRYFSQILASFLKTPDALIVGFVEPFLPSSLGPVGQKQHGGGWLQPQRSCWLHAAAAVCEQPHGVDQGQGEGQAEGGPLGSVPGPPRLRHGEGAGHVLSGGPEDLQPLQRGPGRPESQSLQGRQLLAGHQRSTRLSTHSRQIPNEARSDLLLLLFPRRQA